MWTPRSPGPCRVFTTVMTYPAPSGANNETVCTAGITADHRFIRLYPIDYRYLVQAKQYKKWQWMDVTIGESSRSDPRRESHKVDVESIVLGERLSSAEDKDWSRRRALIDPAEHHTYLELRKLWKADQTAEPKRPWTSMGIVRPTEILDFTWKRQKVPQWTQAQQVKLTQMRLFGPEVQNLRKLPYTFRVKFRCADSPKPHEIMIEDWETGTLYWNCCEWGKVSDEIALPKMREKYLGDVLNLAKRDVRLFMGTTNVKPTWLIIGVFAPPHRKPTVTPPPAPPPLGEQLKLF